MSVFSRIESLVLLFGDVIVFFLSLVLTLIVRYWAIPSQALFVQHLVPFSALFMVWVLVFFIAGLYDRHTVLFKQKMPERIVKAQLINVAIAALFFFLIPYFGITPKTNLFIYLIISWILVLVWRLFLTSQFGVRKPENALLISQGKEADELLNEVNNNTQYALHFVHVIGPAEIESYMTHKDAGKDLERMLRNVVIDHHITTIVADTRNQSARAILPVMYTLLYEEHHLTFIDTMRLYEQIFRRIPLSMLDHTWFLENITTRPRILYNAFHRGVDIAGSIILGIPALLIVPFVALAMYLGDKGHLLSHQERVGRYGEPLRLIKIRTMAYDDQGVWGGGQENKVTRIGAVFRRWRIDELPQLWNVFTGHYSLIGPRPEFKSAVEAYTKAIPYYPARHLITPGLSGWAQIYHEAHPHHGVDIEETKNKLSYDLYYLKNRSFVLDIEIALKTIRTLVSRSGA